MLRHETSRNYPKLAMPYGGIQSTAKNLFLFFFGKSVIPNRKMRKPFFIVLTLSGGIIEKYFTPFRGFPINDQIFYKDVTPSGGSEN